MISAKEVLGLLPSPGLDPSILPQHDPRRARLRFGADPGVGLWDRFRGCLIGGAIGVAMTAIAESSPGLRTLEEPADEI
jgi:hypothetical protein